MFFLREFEQEGLRKPVFICSDLSFQLLDFNVIQISHICIEYDSMAADDEDRLLDSFSWYRYVYVFPSLGGTYRQLPHRDTVLLDKINEPKAENVVFSWA